MLWLVSPVLSRIHGISGWLSVSNFAWPNVAQAFLPVLLDIPKTIWYKYSVVSDSIQGLIAQGRTVAETLEIASDVARKLIEAQQGNNFAKELPVLIRVLKISLHHMMSNLQYWPSANSASLRGMY